MKKLIFSIILLLAGATLNFQAQTRKAEIANPSNFKKMSAGKNVRDCRKSLLACGKEAMMTLELLGLGGEDNFVDKEEVFYFKNGIGVYVFSILGKKPNSIDESRTRIAFTRGRNGAYKFVQAGEQFKCLDGTNRGRWSKQPCYEDSSPNVGMNAQNEKRNTKTTTPLSEIMDLGKFQWIAITGRGVITATEPCYNNLLECGREKAVFLGYEGFGGTDSNNPREETYTYADAKTKKKAGVYLLTMSGYEDDSVSGERVRIGFERDGNSWEFQQGATQRLCARGANAGKWTMERCP